MMNLQRFSRMASLACETRSNQPSSSTLVPFGSAGGHFNPDPVQTHGAHAGDLPSVGDFVPGYEASAWYGIGAPRNTPAEIIDMLNKELNAGLADSKVKARIVELGGTVLGGTPAEFGTILSSAIEKWAGVIKFAGIKVE
jgi:tripartite-type tricarboxylate transporter receptor subunit TctC